MWPYKHQKQSIVTVNNVPLANSPHVYVCQNV